MNQVSHQNANSMVEKDFYKLMNNSNCGCNCRNNFDDCLFAPIAYELDKILYLKQYRSPFDEKMSDFAVSCELLEQEIESSFNNSLLKLKSDEEYFDTKKHSLEIEKPKYIR